MTDLKSELIAVKELWGKDCKVKAQGTSKEAPWPLSVRVKIPQPSDSRCDVADITITLIVKGFLNGKRQLAVEVKADDALPALLVQTLPEHLVELWSAIIAEKCNDSERMGFTDAFQTFQEQFDTLLMTCPDCVDSYLGTDASGASVRRFTLMEAAGDDDNITEDETEESDDEYEGLNLEERLRQIELKEQLAAPQMTEKERLEKEAWAAKRRAMAEQGISEDGVVKRWSKKEQEALWASKQKQGVRQAKTGAKKKKYDGPGSKVEKENAGKKKAAAA